MKCTDSRIGWRFSTTHLFGCFVDVPIHSELCEGFDDWNMEDDLGGVSYADEEPWINEVSSYSHIPSFVSLETT